MKIMGKQLVTALLLLSLVACKEAEEEVPLDTGLSNAQGETEVAEEETLEEEAGESDSSSSQKDGVNLQFEGSTLEGKALDSSMFQDYDLTMLNIWATWCGPCVNEMPYLQSVYEQLPENVQFLTLCQDGNSSKMLAEEILNSSKAEFDTLVPNDSIEEGILPLVRAFPTTLFVDSEGYVVYTMEGAPSSHVAETYLSILQTQLDTLGL